VQVETVTTSDGSLPRAVRSTLSSAAQALLCVAFVREKGLRLIARELEELLHRRVRARLLVTTHFGMGTPAALGTARRLGLEVRILNPDRDRAGDVGLLRRHRDDAPIRDGDVPAFDDAGRRDDGAAQDQRVPARLPHQA
jgi:HKD family nuclease